VTPAAIWEVAGDGGVPIFFDITLEPGAQIAAGDVVGSLEGPIGAIQLIAPASGTLAEINIVAELEPEQISHDVYRDGWLYSIRLTGDQFDAMTAATLAGDEYSALNENICLD
jgi:glycine cleavage system H protein